MRLLHALIVKSLLETLLLGTLAVFFFATAFPPYFHGWGEASPQAIAGWAVDDAHPWDRVQVQLFIDGQFIAAGTANLSRPDVVAAGWAKDGWHGYLFPVAHLAEGPHEARVYVLHASGKGVRQSLQLLGDPIEFTVDSEGTLTDFRRLPYRKDGLAH
jgi:hypothetical protein